MYLNYHPQTLISLLFPQVHSGIVGIVQDGISRIGIPDARIIVRNITRVNSTHARNDIIYHDVSSGKQFYLYIFFACIFLCILFILVAEISSQNTIQ